MISRYQFAKTKANDAGKQVYQSLTLPKVEESEDDIYIITNSMDRLDSLAYRFYGSAKYWWVLAAVNNLGKGTLMVEGGIQLRIPANPANVETLLQNINT
jgi:hypothetical protein